MEHKQAEYLALYKVKCIIPLFIPWLLSEFISFNPIVSFLFAWSASLLLIVYSITGPARSICSDYTLTLQVMRPIILIQLVFVGLMSGTSIFYFMDHLGYYFWKNEGFEDFIPHGETYRLAACQRLYLFAHASLVSGMILKLKKQVHVRFSFALNPDEYLFPGLMFVLGAIYVFGKIPELNQIAVILKPVPKIIVSVILLQGLQHRRLFWILFGSLAYCFSLYQATITGYKEATFVHLIILGFVLFPYYKHLILGLVLPVLLCALYILPTWNNTIRTEQWFVQGTTEEAKTRAIELVFEEDSEEVLQADSWEFLVNRFSEINMFSKYVAHVPDRHTYYGTEIIEHAVYALIPRIFWPSKPNTEMQSMERVYEADIVSVNSEVSAKTRPVVDGYLSAGYLGVFIIMFFYGITCQGLSNLAESLFGGYQVGCILLFNGLFQQLWRGNNLEFILNNVLYGYILMLLIFYVLRWAGIITRLKFIS